MTFIVFLYLLPILFISLIPQGVLYKSSNPSFWIFFLLEYIKKETNATNAASNPKSYQIKFIFMFFHFFTLTKPGRSQLLYFFFKGLNLFFLHFLHLTFPFNIFWGSDFILLWQLLQTKTFLKRRFCASRILAMLYYIIWLYLPFNYFLPFNIPIFNIWIFFKFSFNLIRTINF